MTKKIFPLIIFVTACIGIIFFRVNNNGSSQNKISQKQSSTKKQNAFNKDKYSLDDPKSLWVIVNKQRSLNPAEYAPSDLLVPNVSLRSPRTSDEMKMRRPAALALEKLFSAAKEDGLNLMLASGYRSYGLQKGVYARNVKELGKTEADIESARPGHSEHQTGLAVDVAPLAGNCVIEKCFADTPEGKWLAKNAYKYGFIIRYQPGKQDIVGYIYEPWHIRYVGQELAKEINRLDNPPLESFFGLKAAPNY